MSKYITKCTSKCKKVQFRLELMQNVCKQHKYKIPFKSLGSVYLFYRKLYFYSARIHSINQLSKDKVLFQRNAVLLNFLFIKESLKNVNGSNKTVFAEILRSNSVSTLIIIRDVSWAANQHIRMISEGSRDTEDWSNGGQNSALHHRINYILIYIKIENNYFKLE